MKADPILREVYQMKDQLAREIGNDAGRLVALLREAAKNHPERMVNLQPVRKKSGRKRASTKS